MRYTTCLQTLYDMMLVLNPSSFLGGYTPWHVGNRHHGMRLPAEQDEDRGPRIQNLRDKLAEVETRERELYEEVSKCEEGAVTGVWLSISHPTSPH